MTSFDETVRRSLDSLPPDIAAKLENVAVVVEDENAEDPHVFGLFEQRAYLPARIAIYRRPLEAEFGDDSLALEREIRVTVLHEVARYFGIDEARLDELGYA